MATPAQSGPQTAKLCLEQLEQEVNKNDLIQSKREELLSQLKVLGRDLNNVRSLYDLNGIKTLGHFAFGEYPKSTSREALRCIANALLLLPHTQNSFAELGYLPKAAKGLQSPEDEDEFLLSRILFLMTYNKAADFENVIDEFDVPGSMVRNICRHAQDVDSLAKDATATAALSDTLKLLFNVIHAVPEYASRFTPAASDLLKILAVSAIPTPPLQPPLVWRLNALACMDLATDTTDESELGPGLHPAIDKLVEVLDKAVKAYKATQLDTLVIPLITILRKINAAVGADTRSKMKGDLLPKDSERDLPLGQSLTLASRLLRLMTQPGLVNLPNTLSSLLFELSDKDASSFVKNVGYGYAAGYLMTHKIPIPEDVQRPLSSRDTVPINPITGQRLDKEPEPDLPQMSQEEKEREAERLFVLFERLKATGVVDMQNPAQQARDDGRFEEVDD